MAYLKRRVTSGFVFGEDISSTFLVKNDVFDSTRKITELLDTPDSLTGSKNKLLVVNQDELAMSFKDISDLPYPWNKITNKPELYNKTETNELLNKAEGRAKAHANTKASEAESRAKQHATAAANKAESNAKASARAEGQAAKQHADSVSAKAREDAKTHANTKADATLTAAKAHATAAAGSAESRAKAHAEGKAKESEGRAKAHANTKASEAESRAKQHATAAANKAESNAKASARAEGQAAKQHADSVSAKAREDAKTHANTKADATLTAAKAHATAAAGSAESRAKAHAEGKAAQAERNAKAHADAVKDSLIGGASGAYDTLKKIEAEFKKDDSAIAAVNTQLSNKLNKGDSAANAIKLEGKSKSQVVTEARNGLITESSAKNLAQSAESNAKADAANKYLPKDAKAGDAERISSLNIGQKSSSYIIASEDWWGSRPIGQSQMLKPESKYIPVRDSGYTFKFGARDIGHGGSWLYVSDYRGVNSKAYIGVQPTNDEEVVWDQLYSEKNKPTPADIGAAKVGGDMHQDFSAKALYLRSGSTDSAAIKTSGSGSSTNLDFCLSDDLNGNDRFRFRFTPTGGTGEYSIMELYENSDPKDKKGKVDINGTLAVANDIYEKGETLSNRYANKNLLRDIYRNFTVGGDADTYYPVFFQSGSQAYNYMQLDISRGFNWSAPDTWHNKTHKGGLTLSIRWSGDHAWGGGDKDVRVDKFVETYSSMVGGLQLTTSGLVVWLRGGGASYRMTSTLGCATQVFVYLDKFVSKDKQEWLPRTDTSKVNSEINPKYWNRNGSLFDHNNRVWSASNKPSPEQLGCLSANGGTVTRTLTVGENGNHKFETSDSIATYRCDNETGWRLWMGKHKDGVDTTVLEAYTNGTVNVRGTLKEGGERVYSPRNKPTVDDIGAASRETGNFYNHYQSTVMLLIPYVQKDQRFHESEIYGRLNFRRGSNTASERSESVFLSVKSSYEGNSISMSKLAGGWNWRFCTVVYKGKKWLALQSGPNAQDARWDFEGTRTVRAAGYDAKDQFKLIPYRDSRSGTINKEVEDSLDIFKDYYSMRDNLGGNFYSVNHKPTADDIGAASASVLQTISSGFIEVPGQSNNTYSATLSSSKPVYFNFKSEISHPDLAIDSNGDMVIEKAGTYEINARLLTQQSTAGRGLYFTILRIRDGQETVLKYAYKADALNTTDMVASCVKELQAGDRLHIRLFTLDASNQTVQMWCGNGSAHCGYYVKRLK